MKTETLLLSVMCSDCIKSTKFKDKTDTIRKLK